jgi:hypothetical protein
MEKYSIYDCRWDQKREPVHISDVIREIFLNITVIDEEGSNVE